MATVHPAPNFNIGQQANLLRSEMKGFDTDENALMKILLAMTNQQRVATVHYFQGEMGRDLVEDITCELGSTYEDLSAALLYKPAEYSARQLNDRLEGLVDFEDDDLIELICTRTVDEIKEIAKDYRMLFHKKLTDHLKADSADHARILLATIVAGVCDFEQTPLQAIEHEKNTAAIVECLKNPVVFLANHLERAFKLPEKIRDKTIIRIVVTRCEIDLLEIAKEFARITGRSLLKAVETTVTADYKKALCTLIGNA